MPVKRKIPNRTAHPAISEKCKSIGEKSGQTKNQEKRRKKKKRCRSARKSLKCAVDAKTRIPRFEASEDDLKEFDKLFERVNAAMNTGFDGIQSTGAAVIQTPLSFIQTEWSKITLLNPKKSLKYSIQTRAGKKGSGTGEKDESGVFTINYYQQAGNFQKFQSAMNRNNAPPITDPKWKAYYLHDVKADIPIFPKLPHPLCKLSGNHLRPDVLGMSSDLVYHGMAGSVFIAHIEDYSVPSMHLCVQGSKEWNFIPPDDKAKFEEYVRAKHVPEGTEAPCSQFVRHLHLWFDPEVLKKEAGVRVITYEQHPGEIVVVSGFTYHYRTNLNQVTGYAINYAPEELRHPPAGYVECRSGECIPQDQKPLTFKDLVPERASSSPQQTTGGR
ncbi:MAG: Lysine-specific demethylase 4B [Geoglossum simile]|nr:MAG: Lysine-specific demethylase 4B [Geoglossum simile]